MKMSPLKRLLVGAPIPTAQAHHERLSKRSALAVFASDALSSVVGDHKPGDKVEIDVVRDGDRRTIDVELGNRPNSATQG